MNDLSVINKRNAEAVAATIPKLRADGKFVVSSYHGLHFTSCSEHDTLEEAQAEITRLTRTNTPGLQTQLLEPLVAAVYTPSGDPAASLADKPTAQAKHAKPNKAAAKDAETADAQ